MKKTLKVLCGLTEDKKKMPNQLRELIWWRHRKLALSLVEEERIVEGK